MREDALAASHPKIVALTRGSVTQTCPCLCVPVSGSLAGLENEDGRPHEGLACQDGLGFGIFLVGQGHFKPYLYKRVRGLLFGPHIQLQIVLKQNIRAIRAGTHTYALGRLVMFRCGYPSVSARVQSSLESQCSTGLFGDRQGCDVLSCKECGCVVTTLFD